MRAIRRPIRRLAGCGWRFVRRCCTAIAALPAGRMCVTCGKRTIFVGRARFDKTLLTEWGLNAQWASHMAYREGCCCSACGCSLRSEQLSRALLKYVSRISDSTSLSLSTLVTTAPFQSLHIAEINTAGDLHHYLATSPRVRLSSYGSIDPTVPSEDLMNLSYADGSCDLVVTSETLEHVPDYQRALREIYRILRPGGAHVFTVPIVLDQPQTRQRAVMVGTAVKHLLPPTYHGASEQRLSDFLVFFEFGADFVTELNEQGFDTELLVDAKNPAVTAFICTKKP